MQSTELRGAATSDISRRDFLKTLGIGAAGLLAPKLAMGAGKRLLSLDDSSVVVQCYDDNATSGSTINEAVVQVMVDESIKALTGLNDVGEAWKSLFPGITQSSVVGIKVCNGNGACATHPAVVRSMISGLARMNVGGSTFLKNNVIVWEASDSQLTQAGYTIYDGNDPNTVRCFGTNHTGIGYDGSVTLNINGTSANPSKILSQMSDYVINAATLRTHNLSVVTVSMKNHYGSVSAKQHTNSCNPALPALSQQIRDVITPNNIQKLFVVDGLFGLYSGGPSGAPNFNPKLLLMTRDTVACDFQGQNVINDERQRQGLGLLDAAHIRTAAQSPYNLGTTDVELVEINNPTAVKEQNPVQPGRGLVVTPEPVRDQAVVSFSLARSGRVELDIVSSAGRTEQRLFAGTLGRGRHQVNYRRNGLRAGTYVLRLRGAGADATRKVTVVG